MSDAGGVAFGEPGIVIVIGTGGGADGAAGIALAPLDGGRVAGAPAEPVALVALGDAGAGAAAPLAAIGGIASGCFWPLVSAESLLHALSAVTVETTAPAHTHRAS